MGRNLIPAPADTDDYSEVIQHYTSRKLTWSLTRKPSQKEPQSKVLSYFHGGYPILPIEAFFLGLFGMGGCEGVSYVKLVLGNPGAAVIPTRPADRGS